MLQSSCGHAAPRSKGLDQLLRRKRASTIHLNRRTVAETLAGQISGMENRTFRTRRSASGPPLLLPSHARTTRQAGIFSCGGENMATLLLGTRAHSFSTALNDNSERSLLARRNKTPAAVSESASAPLPTRYHFASGTLPLIDANRAKI